MATINELWRRTLNAVNLTTVSDATKRADRAYEAGSLDGYYYDNGNDDPVQGDLASFGYGRATKHGFRDFTKMSPEQIQNTAWVLYQSNGVAKRVIDLERDYIIGRSTKPSTDDEALKVIIDEFYDKNRMQQRTRDFARELPLFGELCLPVFVRKSDGRVRFGYIGQDEIEQVLPHPHNVLERWIVVCKLKPHETTRRIYRIVREDEDFVRGNRVVPAKHEGKLSTDSQVELHPWEKFFLESNGLSDYTGSCFYFSVNNVSNQMRGYSSLAQSADSLDQHDEVLFSLGEREEVAGYFSWDVTMKGSKETEIQNRAQQLALNPPTKKAQINVHNESEEWKMNVPNLQSPQSIATADALKVHALNGLGHPPHWHGLDNTSTRTTAQSQNTPTWRTFEHHQDEIKHMLLFMYTFARDQAEIASYWKPSPILDREKKETGKVTGNIDLQMPEVSEKDLEATSDVLVKTINALVVAQLDLKVITRQTVAVTVSKILAEMGIDYDPAEELAAVDDSPDVSDDDEIADDVREFLNGNGWRH